MSAENQDRARLIVPGDPRMPPDRSAGELRHVVTLALDAAELRGHTKAVEETAIHSIHKAVAAERAAIVAFLRAGAAVADHQIEECHPEDYTSLRWEREACINYARQIEAGEHHPKETPE